MCIAASTKGTPCKRMDYAAELCERHFFVFLGHDFGNVCKFVGLCGYHRCHSSDQCFDHFNQFPEGQRPWENRHANCEGCIECYSCGIRYCTHSEDPDPFMDLCPLKTDVVAKMEIPRQVITDAIKGVLIDAGWSEPIHVRESQAGYTCWSEDPENNMQQKIEEDKCLKTGKTTLTEIRKLLKRQIGPEAQSMRPTVSETATISRH